MDQTCPRVDPGDGDAIDGDKMIARLNAILALRHGRFAVVISDAEDCEASVVFGTQNQADDVEVRDVEQAADVEIDGGMSVVDADAIVE